MIDACPDTEWRLIFALARFGSLRCPSELIALGWSDIDWDNDCMTVHSPKTEHHPGGESRLVPLFPEFRPFLEDVFELAQPGANCVITRYRDTSVNLRTYLFHIVRRAGLKPWPKPFQNLRSTRETELAEDYPMHVVCAWIGNSQPVATKHYLQVTDEHFRRAAGHGGKAVQQLAVSGRMDSQAGPATDDKTLALPGIARPRQILQICLVSRLGREKQLRISKPASDDRV